MSNRSRIVKSILPVMALVAVPYCFPGDAGAMETDSRNQRLWQMQPMQETELQFSLGSSTQPLLVQVNQDPQQRQQELFRQQQQMQREQLQDYRFQQRLQQQQMRMQQQQQQQQIRLQQQQQRELLEDYNRQQENG